MKIKRVIQGTALTALAAAAWMGAGSTDASAAIADSGVALSTDEATGAKVLSVTGDSDDLQIMVGIAKVNKNNGQAKISAWDVYDSNSAKVDLSKLNVTNDNYIAVKTDDMDSPKFVGIAAAPKRTKVKLNGATAKFKEVMVDNSAYTGTLNIRTSNGDKWYNVTVGTEDFAGYQYQGASLYVRVPADTGKTTAKTEVTDVTDNRSNNATSPVKQLGSLPAKEVKLNIAKQANGPKVIVDYLKGTIKIPKETVVRVVTSTVATSDALSNGSQTNTVTPGAILGSAQKGVLEVCKAASDKGNGKPASKWTRIALTQPEALIVSNVASVNSTGTSVYSVNVSGGSVDFSYNTNNKQKPTGIKLVNKVGVSIDYSIGEPKSDGTGVKAIKTTGTASATLKISGTNSADGKDIYVRISGDKNGKTWPGEWKKVATISVPK